MSWLSNFVRPRIQALVRKRETPENLWLTCDECSQMIFHRDLVANQHVCPHCDHHMRIGPHERFSALFDANSFQRIELPSVVVDPLKFKDEKRYVDRLKENRQQTGEDEAVSVAHGTIDEMPTVIACQNFAFMGGSMGLATGEAMLSAAQLAILQEASLISISATGGARMQEGILSLMQMPRTTIAVTQVREAGLPYISVLTDPTTGGVTASFAMLGDVTIAEPRALIGFAGPRVIENTIRQTLPSGFQRSEYLLDHGMVDMVVPRKELRETLIRLLGMLRRPHSTSSISTIDSTQEGSSS
tara:strand:- start:565 stop:1467 length:903 start_codon:yes stop_codon:yes gene_type:complete